MTILTIIAKERKVRVELPKPMVVSGFELVDYYFPEKHIIFSTEQTMKRGGTTLITFPRDVPFAFTDIISLLNHGISGITIHGLGTDVHIYNSNGSLVFSDEIKKAINIVNLRPVGTNYSCSFKNTNYHLFLENLDLGLIARDGETAKPTSLLAAIPSTTGSFPTILFHHPKVMNYFDLLLLTSDGKDINFNNIPLRISLRILV